MIKKIAAFSALLLAMILLATVSSAPVQAQGTYIGQVFNNTTFTGNPVATRTDTAINFNFEQTPPFTGLTDNFSIRWTGQITFSAGTYTFTANRDENVRVLVDGQVVINFGTPGAQVVTSNPIALTAGTHTIVIEYIEITGQSFIQFQWQLSGGGTQPTVGPTLTPTRTSPPAIPPGVQAATVIRASVLNIRSAPSLGATVLGRVLRGQRYAVIGRDENARWFLLQLGGYQGWAWGYYLAVEGNEFNPPITSPFGSLGVPPGVSDTGTVAQAQATLRLREAPSVATRQIGRVTWGGFLPVVGRTADGYWYQVVWKGTVGWVYSPFVEILQGDLANVPIR